MQPEVCLGYATRASYTNYLCDNNLCVMMVVIIIMTNKLGRKLRAEILMDRVDFVGEMSDRFYTFLQLWFS